MIKYILTAISGALLGGYLVKSKQKKTEEDNLCDYYIYFRADNQEKFTLTFCDYSTMMSVVNRIKKNKFITYKTIVEHSSFEEELRQSILKDGRNPYPYSKKFKLSKIEYGKGTDVFEEVKIK